MDIGIDYVYQSKQNGRIRKYEDSALIFEYLNSGLFFTVVPGVHVDIFENPNEAANNTGCSSFTDGQFIWVSCLSYYFKKYCIQLPPKFVENIRTNNYQVPILSKEESFTVTANLFFDKTFKKHIQITKDETSFKRGDIRINENEISEIINQVLKKWLDQEDDNSRDPKYEQDKELWLLDFISNRN